jgi:hypothetical protein
MKDLVCLAADRNIEAALRGLLERHPSLGIRPVSVDFHTHAGRDPGCFHVAGPPADAAPSHMR